MYAEKKKITNLMKKKGEKKKYIYRLNAYKNPYINGKHYPNSYPASKRKESIKLECMIKRCGAQF